MKKKCFWEIRKLLISFTTPKFPIYFYMRNRENNELHLITVTEKRAYELINHGGRVTLKDLESYFDLNHDIILISEKKSVIVKCIRARLKKLIEHDNELKVLKKFFKDNPEVWI